MASYADSFARQRQRRQRPDGPYQIDANNRFVPSVPVPIEGHKDGGAASPDRLQPRQVLPSPEPLPLKPNISARPSVCSLHYSFESFGASRGLADSIAAIHGSSGAAARRSLDLPKTSPPLVNDSTHSSIPQRPPLAPSSHRQNNHPGKHSIRGVVSSSSSSASHVAQRRSRSEGVGARQKQMISIARIRSASIGSGSNNSSSSSSVGSNNSRVGGSTVGRGGRSKRRALVERVASGRVLTLWGVMSGVTHLDTNRPSLNGNISSTSAAGRLAGMGVGGSAIPSFLVGQEVGVSDSRGSVLPRGGLSHHGSRLNAPSKYITHLSGVPESIAAPVTCLLLANNSLKSLTDDGRSVGDGVGNKDDGWVQPSSALFDHVVDGSDDQGATVAAVQETWDDLFGDNNTNTNKGDRQTQKTIEASALATTPLRGRVQERGRLFNHSSSSSRSVISRSRSHSTGLARHCSPANIGGRCGMGGVLRFSNLRILSLTQNRLRYLADLTPLALELPFLHTLALSGNPVCSQPNYRAQVVYFLGEKLTSLDGQAIAATPNSSASGSHMYQASSSSSSSTSSSVNTGRDDDTAPHNFSNRGSGGGSVEGSNDGHERARAQRTVETEATMQRTLFELNIMAAVLSQRVAPVMALHSELRQRLFFASASASSGGFEMQPAVARNPSFPQLARCRPRRHRRRQVHFDELLHKSDEHGNCGADRGDDNDDDDEAEGDDPAAHPKRLQQTLRAWWPLFDGAERDSAGCLRRHLAIQDQLASLFATSAAASPHATGTFSRCSNSISRSNSGGGVVGGGGCAGDCGNDVSPRSCQEKEASRLWQQVFTSTISRRRRNVQNLVRLCWDLIASTSSSSSSSSSSLLPESPYFVAPSHFSFPSGYASGKLLERLQDINKDDDEITSGEAGKETNGGDADEDDASRDFVFSVLPLGGDGSLFRSSARANGEKHHDSSHVVNSCWWGVQKGKSVGNASASGTRRLVRGGRVGAWGPPTAMFLKDVEAREDAQTEEASTVAAVKVQREAASTLARRKASLERLSVKLVPVSSSLSPPTKSSSSPPMPPSSSSSSLSICNSDNNAKLHTCTADTPPAAATEQEHLQAKLHILSSLCAPQRTTSSVNLRNTTAVSSNDRTATHDEARALGNKGTIGEDFKKEHTKDAVAPTKRRSALRTSSSSSFAAGHRRGGSPSAAVRFESPLEVTSRQEAIEPSAGDGGGDEEDQWDVRDHVVADEQQLDLEVPQEQTLTGVVEESGKGGPIVPISFAELHGRLALPLLAPRESQSSPSTHASSSDTNAPTAMGCDGEPIAGGNDTAACAWAEAIGDISEPQLVSPPQLLKDTISDSDGTVRQHHDVQQRSLLPRSVSSKLAVDNGKTSCPENTFSSLLPACSEGTTSSLNEQPQQEGDNYSGKDREQERRRQQQTHQEHQGKEQAEQKQQAPPIDFTPLELESAEHFLLSLAQDPCEAAMLVDTFSAGAVLPRAPSTITLSMVLATLSRVSSDFSRDHQINGNVEDNDLVAAMPEKLAILDPPLPSPFWRRGDLQLGGSRGFGGIQVIDSDTIMAMQGFKKTTRKEQQVYQGQEGVTQSELWRICAGVVEQDGNLLTLDTLFSLAHTVETTQGQWIFGKEHGGRLSGGWFQAYAAVTPPATSMDVPSTSSSNAATVAVSMRSLERAVRAWIQKLEWVRSDIARLEERKSLLGWAVNGMKAVRRSRLTVIARAEANLVEKIDKVVDSTEHLRAKLSHENDREKEDTEQRSEEEEEEEEEEVGSGDIIGGLSVDGNLLHTVQLQGARAIKLATSAEAALLDSRSEEKEMTNSLEIQRIEIQQLELRRVELLDSLVEIVNEASLEEGVVSQQEEQNQQHHPQHRRENNRGDIANTLMALRRSAAKLLFMPRECDNEDESGIGDNTIDTNRASKGFIENGDSKGYRRSTLRKEAFSFPPVFFRLSVTEEVVNEILVTAAAEAKMAAVFVEEVLAQTGQSNSNVQDSLSLPSSSSFSSSASLSPCSRLVLERCLFTWRRRTCIRRAFHKTLMPSRDRKKKFLAFLRLRRVGRLGGLLKRRLNYQRLKWGWHEWTSVTHRIWPFRARWKLTYVRRHFVLWVKWHARKNKRAALAALLWESNYQGCSRDEEEDSDDVVHGNQDSGSRSGVDCPAEAIPSSLVPTASPPPSRINFVSLLRPRSTMARVLNEWSSCAFVEWRSACLAALHFWARGVVRRWRSWAQRSAQLLAFRCEERMALCFFNRWRRAFAHRHLCRTNLVRRCFQRLAAHTSQVRRRRALAVTAWFTGRLALQKRCFESLSRHTCKRAQLRVAVVTVARVIALRRVSVAWRRWRRKVWRHLHANSTRSTAVEYRVAGLQKRCLLAWKGVATSHRRARKCLGLFLVAASLALATHAFKQWRWRAVVGPKKLSTLSVRVAKRAHLERPFGCWRKIARRAVNCRTLAHVLKRSARWSLRRRVFYAWAGQLAGLATAPLHHSFRPSRGSGGLLAGHGLGGSKAVREAQRVLRSLIGDHDHRRHHQSEKDTEGQKQPPSRLVFREKYSLLLHGKSEIYRHGDNNNNDNNTTTVDVMATEEGLRLEACLQNVLKNIRRVLVAKTAAATLELHEVANRGAALAEDVQQLRKAVQQQQELENNRSSSSSASKEPGEDDGDDDDERRALRAEAAAAELDAHNVEMKRKLGDERILLESTQKAVTLLQADLHPKATSTTPTMKNGNSNNFERAYDGDDDDGASVAAAAAAAFRLSKLREDGKEWRRRKEKAEHAWKGKGDTETGTSTSSDDTPTKNSTNVNMTSLSSNAEASNEGVAVEATVGGMTCEGRRKLAAVAGKGDSARRALIGAESEGFKVEEERKGLQVALEEVEALKRVLFEKQTSLLAAAVALERSNAQLKQTLEVNKQQELSYSRRHDRCIEACVRGQRWLKEWQTVRAEEEARELGRVARQALRGAAKGSKRASDIFTCSPSLPESSSSPSPVSALPPPRKAGGGGSVSSGTSSRPPPPPATAATATSIASTTTTRDGTHDCPLLPPVAGAADSKIDSSDATTGGVAFTAAVVEAQGPRKGGGGGETRCFRGSSSAVGGSGRQLPWEELREPLKPPTSANQQPTTTRGQQRQRRQEQERQERGQDLEKQGRREKKKAQQQKEQQRGESTRLSVVSETVDDDDDDGVGRDEDNGGKDGAHSSSAGAAATADALTATVGEVVIAEAAEPTMTTAAATTTMMPSPGRVAAKVLQESKQTQWGVGDVAYDGAGAGADAVVSTVGGAIGGAAGRAKKSVQFFDSHDQNNGSDGVGKGDHPVTTIAAASGTLSCGESGEGNKAAELLTAASVLGHQQPVARSGQKEAATSSAAVPTEVTTTTATTTTATTTTTMADGPAEASHSSAGNHHSARDEVAALLVAATNRIRDGRLAAVEAAAEKAEAAAAEARIKARHGFSLSSQLPVSISDTAATAAIACHSTTARTAADTSQATEKAPSSFASSSSSFRIAPTVTEIATTSVGTTTDNLLGAAATEVLNNSSDDNSRRNNRANEMPCENNNNNNSSSNSNSNSKDGGSGGGGGGGGGTRNSNSGAGGPRSLEELKADIMSRLQRRQQAVPTAPPPMTTAAAMATARTAVFSNNSNHHHHLRPQQHHFDLGAGKSVELSAHGGVENEEPGR